MKKISTVLIVEDEAVLREAFEIVLQSAGYRTMTACNGKEALDRLAKKTPDVILLDVYMPVLRGDELLLQPKRDQFPNMQIVVFSNIADSDLKKQLLSNGADRFVLKADMCPSGLIKLMHSLEKAK